jgi:fumarate hydratase class II
MTSMRIERDTFGIVDVPYERYWGANTQRAIEHFEISCERMPTEIILALTQVKAACALVNLDLGLLPSEKALAIVRAAEEVLAGRHNQEFPLAVWQTGSGTQSNMNVNEVLANRSSELLGGKRGEARLVHPNDDVNLGQSSNDVFPTAMHLAAVLGITRKVLPSLTQLRDTLAEKSVDFAKLLKIGRTHLQDATPLTLGQEFSGYVAQLVHAEESIRSSLPALYQLAIGGTAVGTGINTHLEFGERVAARIAAVIGVPFVSVENKFAALSSHESVVAGHGTLRTLSVALMKIANDIRWLASGPRCGLGEISIPENEAGSSIMPGKVNPTQCEALTMLCCQVMGNDVAIGIGAASGNFELNVFKPLIAHNFHQSVRLLADGMRSFERHCARGIEAREDRIAELLGRSLMLATALVPHIGYDKATAIARKAHRENTSLRDAALELGTVSAEDFDRWMISLVGDHIERTDTDQ